MKKFSFLFSSLFLLSGHTQDKVIYGQDNRKDLYEVKNPTYLEYARATAAQMPASSLSSTLGPEIQILGRTLQSRNVCAKERFSNQITAARCSGFLVAPDLIMTAGHCVKDQNDCNGYSWVFDYKMAAANQMMIKITRNEVYRCSRIIARAMDNATMNDFALIKLDRSVVGRKPLVMRQDGEVKAGEPLMVIGYPSNLPAKLADGAKVRDSSNPFYFVADLDSYGGNSGSPVINEATGMVEGILVRGEQDYIYDYNLGCSLSKVCEQDACRGEDVTKIKDLVKYLKHSIQ